MKKQLICIVMFFSAITLFAQPVIQFENTTIDFGTIKEDGGKASRKFEFTNTGNQDLLLTSVKPGCGCTAADYTKTPVAPGQKGFIQATYDPYNRPGNFHKNIKVTTNEPKFTAEGATEQPYVIYIKGNVEKKTPSKFEVAGYNTGTGNIRIKDNNVKIDLLNTETKSFSVLIKNFSEAETTIEPLNFPNYITMEKTSLKADEEKAVSFKYDAAKRGEFGNFKDVITFQTSDPDSKLTVILESNITEDFSKLSKKQLKDAPKAKLDSLTLDFGKVEKNTVPTKQMKLYNNGKDVLIIRQVKSANSFFSVVSDKMEVAKNSFATLTVTLNAKNRRGVQNAQIDIITNDPENANITITCKGEILQ